MLWQDVLSYRVDWATLDEDIDNNCVQDDYSIRPDYVR